MSVAYYLSPWVAAYAIGGGNFSLIPPLLPEDGRPVNISKCLLYGQWNLTPNSSITLRGVTGTGFGKAICITRVDQDDATHALIVADAAIRRLPFSDKQLDLEFQSLSGSQQQFIVNGLENLRLDSTWIVPTTLVREIVRYIMCVLIGAKELGVDFPETDLANKLNTLSPGQKNRVIAYLDGWKATTSDINSNTPIRDIVTKIGRIARGKVLLGPDEF